ncbi:methylglutaconyl-CoA hydratase, mitochondrial [Tetranychus urticae]|uniref:Enoyl-CoA hydratase n=1 Tax=Tetranychus urticae TaxID=32264 RepID=T1K9T2_TETUR|nr:methylglutaconyl-CoA hydratase, mitochondrial [Tetranychus urticae]XP_015784109.1 methylglutaconyl-CoA hydratase, mitochondrial [Tetranychus urticae]XP_025016521.1 methylglutaconyl-CoA hydratase, mitochondrial [Tetranychus urticae]
MIFRIFSPLFHPIKPVSVPFRSLAVKREDFFEKSDEIVKVQTSQDVTGLFVLSLNHGKKRNALSEAMISLMEQSLSSLKSDRSVRCLILRSQVDGVFCAGADLKERFEMDNHDVGPFVERLRNLANNLSELPFPTIAAIDGAAFGGGLEFALACDLRVASLRAKLGLVETKLGILPGAGGTQRLPRLIGLSKAKDLIFTGRKVSAEEAHSIGLVDYLTSDEDKEDKEAAFNRSVGLAKDICSSGPLGVRWAKFALTKGITVDIHSGMAFEKAAYDQIIWTKDRVEGMKSFLEKRSPNYKGE